MFNKRSRLCSVSDYCLTGCVAFTGALEHQLKTIQRLLLLYSSLMKLYQLDPKYHGSHLIIMRLYHRLINIQCIGGKGFWNLWILLPCVPVSFTVPFGGLGECRWQELEDQLRCNIGFSDLGKVLIPFLVFHLFLSLSRSQSWVPDLKGKAEGKRQQQYYVHTESKACSVIQHRPDSSE